MITLAEWSRIIGIILYTVFIVFFGIIPNSEMEGLNDDNRPDDEK